MEFLKERVYTALNADELKVGSKVYLADNLADLRHIVETDYKAMTLSSINPESFQCRFCEGITGYALAYLVEEPEEKKLKCIDLKAGDVITDGKLECIVVTISKNPYDRGGICVIADTVNKWLSDDDLKQWEKVEE